MFPTPSLFASLGAIIAVVATNKDDYQGAGCTAGKGNIAGDDDNNNTKYYQEDALKPRAKRDQDSVATDKVQAAFTRKTRPVRN